MTLNVTLLDLSHEERDVLRLALKMDGVLIASAYWESKQGDIIRRLASDGVFYRTDDKVEAYRLTADGETLARQAAS